MVFKVLMIDDHQPILEGYKSILTYNSFGHQLETTTINSAEKAFEFIVSEELAFDFIFIDLTLPPFLEKNIVTGEDLIPIAKKHQPKAKLIVLTSHSESVLLFRIIKQYKPEGFLIKSDFQSEELNHAFNEIVNDRNYYSKTVEDLMNSIDPQKELLLDGYNRQILELLAQGIKTKNFPELLHLSQSAIDKRKATIKILLGIDKGNDEDILKAARILGLI